jgi:tRNA1Val (adenine37-N6)-methyltransferase
MAFRFKQFIVEDDRSTMRIGTDAILLGAWADPGSAQAILEIGTGCGVISLMLAQKSDARIDAIDIDEESIKQAGSNFLQSPWSEKLHPLSVSLQDLINTSEQKYDLVITNPPFFIDSLPSPDARKNRARHTTDLSRQELLAGIKHFLNDDGIFLVILPAEESRKFSALAETAGLFIQKQMKVRPKAGKPVNRVLSGFGFQPFVAPLLEELAIRNEDNIFTTEYIAFTLAYYFSLR